ncbi:iron chaperone [Mucilaginibacter phyllosphaerae]|uniref:Uncharacterized protein YdhG (YjbR/CyaY superfamily) n=1 Tax=Mucilaginibacter phyllosphaerae TaxID=1812349 RepID=A0A4Y8AEH1_9SPHI|nr:DUF1801 domain-containing protein [Mucilaginibacter phyllosphaerae]MBB3970211.1 uncharacterized protein YdhG (YjbR/CyaY superfamily) [Mucilaginibacter phyllosphaerae]TEW66592.1 hypothetical protein E2R65_09210 [Mucilaginibacter phyllosphaerae]GGH10551.1 hypothetical protein GCM10007352_16380 [Mucilaginibacter phyllosphaerae]
MNKPKDVDDYIRNYPADVQVKLQQLRNTIKKTAPQAKEVISYSMPAYKANGVLVYFAAWEKHIGFYPGAGAISHFKDRLSVYKGAKGSVQFPLGEPLPLELINKIVDYRLHEDEAKAIARRIKKANELPRQILKCNNRRYCSRFNCQLLV